MSSRAVKASSRQSWVTVPPDSLLFGVVAALVGLGLIMIYSASSATAARDNHDAAYYLKRQLIWLVISLVCATVAYRLDYRKLAKVAQPLLLLNGVLLFAVLVPHIGLATGGARRWLGAGSFELQPSEFAKLTLDLLSCRRSFRKRRAGA